MAHSLSDTAANAPRFRQIVDHLRREIVTGELQEHAALASERALAEKHGVSRMTARRALETIEAEGLAYSADRRGRFVSPQRLNYNINSMTSFVTDAEATGIDLKIELIESRQITANARLCNILSVPKDEDLYEYKRLFRNDDHATFLETEFIIATDHAEFQQQDPLRETPELEQRFSPLGHSADAVIRMRAAQPDEALLLGLPPFHATIELEQVIRDIKGKAFCLSHQVWRGELAQFSARTIVNR